MLLNRRLAVGRRAQNGTLIVPTENSPSQPHEMFPCRGHLGLATPSSPLKNQWHGHLAHVFVGKFTAWKAVPRVFQPRAAKSTQFPAGQNRIDDNPGMWDNPHLSNPSGIRPQPLNYANPALDRRIRLALRADQPGRLRRCTGQCVARFAARCQRCRREGDFRRTARGLWLAVRAGLGTGGGSCRAAF